MPEIESGSNKKLRYILIVRSVGGLLAVPPITIYLALQAYYYTFQNQIDEDLFSMTFAFALSLWNYIIIIMIGLPYHIYFVKHYNITLSNYIWLGLSIGIVISIIWVFLHFKFFHLYDVTVTLLTCILSGGFGGMVFWFVVFWPRDAIPPDQHR